jgi:hypothetical protein
VYDRRRVWNTRHLKFSRKLKFKSRSSGRCAAWWCCRTSTFRRTMLPRLQGDKYSIPYLPIVLIVHDISASIVTRLRAWRPGFDSRQGLGFFSFATASRPALRPIQPPIKWVPGVQRPGSEADHSSPSRPEVNACSCISTPPIHLHGAVLVKHRNNYTFTFTYGYVMWFVNRTSTSVQMYWTLPACSVHVSAFCYRWQWWTYGSGVVAKMNQPPTCYNTLYSGCGMQL